ncbi:MAG TPA: methyltransferase [Vicinamibacteria bacterium]|nr:methyltransferase [Vicinamibacteria bacterium]
MTEVAPVPPEGQLMQAMFGFMVSRGVAAAAELDVADALRDGPLYYTELAGAVGADQRALHRVMRMLTAVGVFAEPEPGKYALNEVSELLRNDNPASFRDMAAMITSESHWMPWGRLTDTLRSGKSGPQHAFGTDIFAWFQRDENKDQWNLFNAAMTSFSTATSQAVAESYDFSGFRKIVDIGGGHGFLLKSILGKAPQARGVLFDLPGVVDGDDRDELGERIERVGGDFFEAVPGGGDCYTMKHIIHDWSDDHCRKLLSNVAKVMHPSGSVLVLEIVMPESPEPHPAKFMDVNMLAMTEGGCERTEKEYAALFESSGLALKAIHPTKSPVSIVEAKKA